MDQEVPLPPLRSIRHRSPAKAPEHPFRKPKRLSSRLSQSSLPSSDPALFSSDDIPSSSLENYYGQQLEHSRKRRYRGTWWGEMAKDAKRKRADFKEKRNLDSGVWMGSDESSSDCLLSSEASSCEDFIARAWAGNEEGELKLPHWNTESIKNETGQVAGPVFAARNIQSTDESQEHRNARRMVNDCLDKGQESVDLSNFGLKSIPTDLLRPLVHLTKQPAVADGPVTDEVFTSLTPALRLFLAGNHLTELTSELFELGNLNVLSVRNNELVEIPGAIRKLTNLQEVNLSVNQLTTLPWEVLWLIRKGDLKQLTIHPNPFMSLEEAAADIEHWHHGDGPEDDLRSCEYEGPAPEDAWAPIHIATSRVQRFDAEGKPVLNTKSSGKFQDPSHKSPRSRVPSLRELALLECSKAPYLDQFLAGDATSVEYPEPVIRLLRKAVSVRNAGGMSCSVCHRSFVIPRTEWIEWWDCATYENGLKFPRASGAELRPLPFLRRGCSWGCVPQVDES
ncbi:Leucine Rich Repeat domain protein [Talaromyces stipitatus ATCC 10500]|uniref:Leucine Rich Repeat domain protein n=1 Tax=Talaromyces stipitatus (strain ATCC 10500 / CBS 375.48 / QM 6759 / NRRL 1006) TaxID=441959 RepID=B8M6V0_TALSN|nr:Leucine Rich Repeat domain protein [Talaromyces stipitatus ATCC 10500]EED20170.1 Leucine Rich Repeat domain protein [Talaromyces stipitatus ATCC 10500]